MDPSLLQITYHGVEPSPALTARVTKEAAKLGQFFDRITSCRVVIDRPHHHQRKGEAFDIHIEIGVPREMIVVRQEPADAALRDPYVAVRDAFDVARRRLEDYARRLRGDTKHHAPNAAISGATERTRPAP